jgi:hypothetical protein
MAVRKSTRKPTKAALEAENTAVKQQNGALGAQVESQALQIQEMMGKSLLA